MERPISKARCRRVSSAACGLALLILALLLAAAPVLRTSTAEAKALGPGHLRVCNSHRCISITARTVLRQLSDFYYGDAPLARTPPPPLAVIEYELRFSDGYVTGIVASPRLDRFLSYGVNADRFSRGQWYRLPTLSSQALRRLTAILIPLRLTRAAEDRSH